MRKKCLMHIFILFFFSFQKIFVCVSCSFSYVDLLTCCFVIHPVLLLLLLLYVSWFSAIACGQFHRTIQKRVRLIPWMR